MATNILTKIFGSRNDRLLKQYRSVVTRINALHGLRTDMWGVASRFVQYCAQDLHVHPSSTDFSNEFTAITAAGSV